MNSVTALNISTYGYGEAALYNFLKTQIDNGQDVLADKFRVYGSPKDVSQIIKSHYNELCPGGKLSIVADEDATYVLINGAPHEINSGVIKIEGGLDSSSVDISSGADLMEILCPLIKNNLTQVGSKIYWVYGADGASTSIPVSVDNLPITEMYPNLTTPLSEYYDRYIMSPASILVLIGPPGTGKTSFLRGLLHHTSSSATVSYDPNILEHDSIFANFMSGPNKFMILEDSDSFLASRSKGNTVMHKFLNVGDGLVSTRSKKIVFTTNLPSTRDIDPALIRPGRCFDVLHFNKLDSDNCRAVVDKLGLDLTVPEEGATVAELLNPPGAMSSPRPLTSVGFIK